MKRFSRNFIVTGLVTALIAVVTSLPSLSPPARAAGPWYVGPGGSDGSTYPNWSTRRSTVNGIITPTITLNANNPVCNFTKYAGNPVLLVGPDGAWDDDSAWDPTVIKEDSLYKMWYTGDDGTNPSRIGLATSTDGITWTKSGSNPVLSPGESWEIGGISGANVISSTGLYRMWYTGIDSSGTGRIGYASSSDGVTWTKYAGNPVLSIGSAGGWEDTDVLGPAVLKDGSTYHMWYDGNDGAGQSAHHIGHAISTDGLTWTKDPANPVLDIGPPGDWDWLSVYGPNVLKLGTQYMLWYSAKTLPLAWQTGYALSSNGSSWTRQQMLIHEGSPGTFDDASADYPSVISDTTIFKIWYSGFRDGGTYTIGYATAEICGSAPPINLVYLPIVLKNSGGTCPAYYTDDFSNLNSGWLIDDSSTKRFTYIGGQYQIWVKQPGWIIWSTPGAKATDFTAAVSARRASGSKGDYGIVFGINADGNQWYQFMIGPNNYSIWKYDNGNWTALRNWTSSSHIKTGINWNRLKVIRTGTTISVYANNQPLTTISDNSFTGLGRIGLIAASSNSGLDARFDDFSLYPASCGVSAAETGFEMGEPDIYEAPVPPGLEK